MIRHCFVQRDPKERSNPPTNPRLARPSHVRCRCPRNSPPSAAESRCPAPAPADRESWHRTARTVSLQTRQTHIPLAAGSAVPRTGDWPDAPVPPSQPITPPAVAAAAASHRAASWGPRRDLTIRFRSPALRCWTDREGEPCRPSVRRQAAG
jgi:hypothetical protein